MDLLIPSSAFLGGDSVICRATDTNYPAQRYSFAWDPTSGNASLKILGQTFRYAATSEVCKVP